jgi:PPOX class probable F420-dependent enzyme
MRLNPEHPVTRMSQSEKETFLAGLHVGILSIPREKAAPLTAPVWYGYSPGADLSFLTMIDSLKGRLLREAMPVSLCVQNEAPPYQYVTVEGRVTSIQPSTLEGELRPLARRYLGREGGDAYTEREGVENTVTVRVAIDRWLAVDYS